MKAIKNILISVLLVVMFLVLLIPQKNDSEGSNKENGLLANEEVISSIKQDLNNKENSLLASEGDVFWSPNGTIWHFTYECGYLANSQTVYHGTVEQAMFEGKERPCQRCGGFDIESIYEQIKDNEVQMGDVFFTKTGVVWHRDITCPTLINADKIYFGNKSLAISLGKTRACTECEN